MQEEQAPRPAGEEAEDRGAAAWWAWPVPLTRQQWVALAVMPLVCAVVLKLMGRTLVCACGTLRPLVLDPASSHTSQHLLDPYSLTHMLHGVLFAGATWLVLRRWLGPGGRLVTTIALEAAWELLENTPWIIEKYRAETISLDYYGDSVLNSLSDVGACALGFLIARRLPGWGSLLVFAGVELLLAAWIRDGLLLNIVMLVHPFEAIRAWQTGG